MKILLVLRFKIMNIMLLKIGEFYLEFQIINSMRFIIENTSGYDKNFFSSDLFMNYDETFHNIKSKEELTKLGFFYDQNNLNNDISKLPQEIQNTILSNLNSCKDITKQCSIRKESGFCNREYNFKFLSF